MNTKLWLAGLAVAITLCGVGRTIAGGDQQQPAPFGALEAASADAVKAKALAWLRAATNDSAAQSAGEALWVRTDHSVLDNLADTFALGNVAAAKMLGSVRDSSVPPPVGVPELLKDTKAEPFFRANLGLAVARHLSNRRIHEEALTILTGFSPEQTVEPATYLFHRAVCEHALLKKDDASKTAARLIQDAVGSPERYKTVAALVMLDMETWRKDLNNVARLMDNSERRLELGRGGPQTQKIQKEAIARLDELIKELENKAKAGAGECNGSGECPNGGSCPEGSGKSSSSGANPKNPMPDSRIATNGGPGRVDVAQLQKSIEAWGKLPPGERAKAMQEIQDLVNGLSPIHREAFERYFEEINNQAIRGTPPNTKK